MIKKSIVFLTSLLLAATPVLAGVKVNQQDAGEIRAAADGETAGNVSGTGFTEKNLTVYTNGEKAGELPVRFYEAAPNVPYMGFAQYSEYMRKQPLTVKATEDGKCALVNAIGEEILCDAEEDVITVKDWARFFDEPLPLEDRALGWKDTTLHCVRIKDIAYEGEARPVEFDFAKYGIAMYADEDDVYLPVSILCNMMTDIALNYMVYNGENLYAQRMDLQGAAPEGFWDSGMYNAQFEGEERPEDLVRECYADLCFSFDYFFGHPGVAPLDEALAEKGLDGALGSLGKEGESIRKGLTSPDLFDYISAANRLFFRHLSDGHTVFMSGASILSNPAYMENVSFADRTGVVIDLMNSEANKKQLVNQAIPLQRERCWGGETYIESGSTAILRLDTFMPDEKAWDSFYSGEGEFPEDSLGIVISGLRKAAENPEIKNVIFDLSCNGGGSPDVMMAILAVTTGQEELYGINKLTGQRMTFIFEADTNFDGVYDEKDKEVHYDFNYGILTTRHAFSCGNLFPIIAKDGGAVIIGEPTSGGSCCVQFETDAQGLFSMMSSAQWQLVDSDWISVERGCTVDLPIEPKSGGILDRIISIAGVNEGAPSFADYYDEARLDEMMNAYFGSEEAADTAA